ncbi:MAG: GNAT family N-acetyltransferase [Oscillospiraceae bacterium]|jgi:ribosomal protein S18 acetylase RimI-like enzyme|nr:GNAT family N-acetyltransferase [Oscillospiraceae bacterium]
MTDREIIRRIDAGTNNYIRLFGEAPHMESIDKVAYRIIRPKKGEQGVRFVCDIRQERLDGRTIREIKRLGMPVWWPLQISGAPYRRIHHRKRKPGGEPDELYMAVFPGEGAPHEKARLALMVESPEDFARWAALTNSAFSNAYACIHPRYHYPLCERGALRCYYIETGGQMIATAAIMREAADASLEFVMVDPAHRRQGLASGICAAAVADAFAQGAELVTLRASNEGTRELYTSLGFKIYNEAI